MSTDPATQAIAAQKFASVPAQACIYEYVAAMIAVEKNDDAATRAYAQQAAAYARRAGIAVSAPAAPPVQTVASNRGAPGSDPLGDYICSDANTAGAGSGAYGTMTHYIGSDRGNIWLLDARRYAGPYSKNDISTYEIAATNSSCPKAVTSAWTSTTRPPRTDVPRALTSISRPPKACGAPGETHEPAL